MRPRKRVGVLDFLKLVRWLDGSPVLDHVEPYPSAILADVPDARLPDGRVRYNLALLGRAKKNWKSADLVLSALFALVANDSPGGNVVYLVANDETQAGDDLGLAKKLIEVSPHLAARVTLRAKAVSRRDGRGELIILPAQDVLGSHGKSYVFAGFDEVHGYRTWDLLLEALQLDPTRADAQMVLTSYASLYHRPGVPLFDLLAQARAGADPRLYCSWYAADWSTDPAAAALPPAERAKAEAFRASAADLAAKLRTILDDWVNIAQKPVAQQRQLLRKLVPDRITVMPHVDAKRKWVDWAGDLAVAPIISGIAPAAGNALLDGMDRRWWPQGDSTEVP